VDGRRSTIWHQFLNVTDNLASDSASVDTRTHAKRTLDLIEALIEGRATNDIIESVIDNTRFMRMTIDQLLGAHSYYSARVSAEEATARVSAARATGRRILTRFTSQ